MLSFNGSCTWQKIDETTRFKLQTNTKCFSSRSEELGGQRSGLPEFPSAQKCPTVSSVHSRCLDIDTVTGTVCVFRVLIKRSVEGSGRAEARISRIFVKLKTLLVG